MQEQLVTFKTAKLAKEKGFDEFVIDTFTNSGAPTNRYDFDPEDYNSLKEALEVKNSTLMSNYITRPSQSFLQKWLREKCKIIVQVVFSNVTSYDGNKILYYFQIGVGREHGNYYDHIDRSSEPYLTYEEALEVGLVVGLKYVDKLSHSQ